MIDTNDDEDVILASVNVLMKDITNLGNASKNLGELFNSRYASPEDVMKGLINVIAMNSSITVSLGSVVMAHLKANGFLKHKAKLHS